MSPWPESFRVPGCRRPLALGRELPKQVPLQPACHAPNSAEPARPYASRLSFLTHDICFDPVSSLPNSTVTATHLSRLPMGNGLERVQTLTIG
jgi:hypothetical protein